MDPTHHQLPGDQRDAAEEKHFAEHDEAAEIIDVNATEDDAPMDEDDDDIDDGAAAGAQDDDDDDGMMELHDDSVQGFFEHKQPVHCVALHPMHPTIALSGGEDDMAYLWNVATGERLHALAGHTDSVIAAAFNMDGSLCATGGMDGKVFVWNSATGAQVAALEASDEVMWIHWHPKGNVLLVGTNDGQAWLYNLPSGNVMCILAGVHTAAVTCGQFTPDGKRVITGAEDGTLAFWDPRTATPVFKYTPDDGRWFQEEVITAIGVHHNSNVAVVGGSEGTARAINLTNGNLLASFSAHSSSIESITFSRALPIAALASTDNNITLFDVTRMAARATLRHEDAVIKAQWTADGLHLVSCSADRTVRVWDARTGAQLHRWMGHQEPILAMDMTVNGETVVTGGDDGVCLVFSPLAPAPSAAAGSSMAH
ncbi:hypothetical protein GGF32_009017 [Allomyces javanicus]|nr:hypothetical protein GGF32_009017 [Allomyces javanicus]